ncbi:MAG TPA: ABC transporter ATP-binding protein [Phycisphaerae bacterium]|nr:ABC transporter ATP-binding protein [Phycisphaerae bacterium]HPS53178.1 ABC transporter ATP-binding protein [Phycisphaerae bacterium]
MNEIILKNVTKKFDAGRIPAVDDVSLEIKPGELFFLLGPSGCGKTTLLRIIAGLVRPDSGRVIIAGRDVTKLNAEKRDTAMIFQNYALWPHMTVAQNVAFGPKMKGVNSEKCASAVENSLRLVEMHKYASRKPNELSGGQQQRVAVARALAADAECLLLDEPLSNLDAKLRANMRLQLRELIKRSNTTAVYVTHDQAEALAMADRIAVMNNGKIVQVATPQELYSSPSEKFVADFIGEANFIAGRVVKAGETTTVETSCGNIESAATGFVVGQAVTCCVRPECVRLVSPDETADGLPGTMEFRIFTGGGWQFVFSLAQGENWKASIHGRQCDTIEPGTVAMLLADPKDVILLKE